MGSKRFCIKTKRDWGIAAVFACLLSFVLAQPLWQLLIHSWSGVSLDEFFMGFFPDKMTYANYPKSYAPLFVAVVLMTILVVVVLVLHKKTWKLCLMTALAGILASAAVIAAFHIHCRLIVSTAADSGSFTMRLSSFDETYRPYTDKFSGLDAGSEAAREIAELSYALKPLKGEAQKEARENYAKLAPDAQPEMQIWITYPEKYGHTFWLMVRMSEDYIYIFQTQEQKVFYEDNGLRDKITEMIQR